MLIYVYDLGTRCDSCSSGHYLAPDASTLCDACSCNTQTAVDQNCNTTTGQCDCIALNGNGDELGFGGRTCEECTEGFFQFSTIGLIVYIQLTLGGLYRLILSWQNKKMG